MRARSVRRRRAGHLNVERATALGLPPGPLYQQLKLGEAVTTKAGNVIRPEEVVEPPRPGRKARPCSRPCCAISLQHDLSPVEVAS